jgi:hypothetical protein
MKSLSAKFSRFDSESGGGVSVRPTPSPCPKIVQEATVWSTELLDAVLATRRAAEEKVGLYKLSRTFSLIYLLNSS